MEAWIEVVTLALGWLALVVGTVAAWGWLRRRQREAELDAMVRPILEDARRRREGGR